MKFDVGNEVDVYPVGWLDAWKRRRMGALRGQWRYTKTQIRARNWRAVKNSLNGYIAEPRIWPEELWRGGTGWTKRRALRSLQRQKERQ